MMEELLKRISAAGLIAECEDGKLKVFATTDEVDDSLIYEIKSCERELLSYLEGKKGLTFSKSSYQEISRCEPSSSYPLSNAQLRLWLASQSIEASVSYNMINHVVLDGTYDIALFKKAISAVIDRHETLRTIFKVNEEGEVRQYVLESTELNFIIDHKDFRSAKNPEESIRSFISKDSKRPFDLAKGPLFRAFLFQVGDAKNVFYFNMHHIISDAWSMDILARDAMKYYEGFIMEIEPNISTLNIQYKDYAFWQLNRLSSSEGQSHKNYWLALFEGKVPVLDLPFQKKRPKEKTFNGRSIGTRLPKDLVANLIKFSITNESSLYIGLLAATKILLYRYTGETDIVVGNIVSGREHLDLEDQIGFYVNILPLRSKIKPNSSCLHFYHQIKQHVFEAHEHQSYPFDQLVNDLNLARIPNRGPLLDVFVNYYLDSGLKESNDKGECYDRGDCSVRTDIEFNFIQKDEIVNLIVNYNKDIYEYELIEQLVVHYMEVLERIISSPLKRVGEIDFLKDSEQATLLQDFNATRTHYPRESSVVDLFCKQAQSSPDEKAVIFGDSFLSYEELDHHSNRFARYLRTNGVGQGDMVCICIDRSLKMMIGLLGILKAGGAYVPIDPAYPKKRIEVIVKDTETNWLLTQETLKEKLKDLMPNLSILSFDEIFDKLEQYSSQPFDYKVAATQLAYVMYTSGSMGVPKGVMVEHRNIVRLVKASNYFSFDGQTKVLSTGSLSFDATTFEYWGPLLNGGQLVLTTQEVLLDSEALKKEIVDKKVNTMWFTAGWFNQLVDTDIELFSSLSTALVGGDRLSPQHINKLLLKYDNLQLVNGYGPTENTTFSLTYNIQMPSHSIPIGFPISNSTAYVMNDSGVLQPIGVVGEICLGGDGLSKGYLKRPELNKEKFFNSPYLKEERLYRTGDLGRWLPDGCIEFVDRKDNQVKIRGYRIELGEIEIAISKLNGIDQCAVLVIPSPSGEKQLVSYVMGDRQVEPINLQTELKDILPEYMIPKIFVSMAKMPLTQNGKIDRNNLPTPDENAYSKTDFVKPSTETEIKLAETWKELLGIDAIGLHDNFFELGGHSILLTKLAFAIAKEFGVKIEFNKLFIYPTLQLQAQYVSFILEDKKNTAGKENEDILYL